MKYRSIIEARSSVLFPEFTGERVYMRPFFKATGLPKDLKRWQPTVDAMLDQVETDQPIYIMIDEGFVPVGQAQRRKGLHIDGYWNPAIFAHREITPSGHTAEPKPSGHNSVPVDRHAPRQPVGHNHEPPKYDGIHTSQANTWQNATFEAPEGLILASNVCASRGFTGEFEGIIGDGGDCSHIDLSGLIEFKLNAGQVYAGNVTALHESIPVEADAYRQLVRLNVPGWSV